ETVALNVSRSRSRRLRLERLARPRLADPPTAEGPTGDRLDVVRALAALPRPQREVTVLRHYLDLSTAEIADQMRTSEGTVKSQLSKARAHLVDALAIDEKAQGNGQADH